MIREKKRAIAGSHGASTSGYLADQIYHTKVAGRTSEYVNSVLEGVKVPGAKYYFESDSDSE